MKRDFTFVDDIVEGVIRTMDHVAESDPGFNPDQPDPGRSNAPFRVFNIGNHNPVELMAFIGAIEKSLGKTAEKNFLPLQDGDVPATYADTSELNAWTGFAPATSVEDGVGRFVAWYRGYYGV
jgi:UDP-glucuronate 4-epimerase